MVPAMVAMEAAMVAARAETRAVMEKLVETWEARLATVTTAAAMEEGTEDAGVPGEAT